MIDEGGDVPVAPGSGPCRLEESVLGLRGKRWRDRSTICQDALEVLLEGPNHFGCQREERLSLDLVLNGIRKFSGSPPRGGLAVTCRRFSDHLKL